jgi:hypothetical protein
MLLKHRPARRRGGFHQQPGGWREPGGSSPARPELPRVTQLATPSQLASEGPFPAEVTSSSERVELLVRLATLDFPLSLLALAHFHGRGCIGQQVMGRWARPTWADADWKL